jgi:hypothetical protein
MANFMNGKLGTKIWEEIEEPQGHSYLSDVIEELDDEKVLFMMEQSLWKHQECVKILKKWIKKSTR